MKLGNLGRIDRTKLERLAQLSGISREDLDKALATHGVSGLTFTTGGTDR
ncbi:hypothetical protein [Spirillospora sp. CA-294931]